MRWLEPARALLHNVIVIWRGQSGFGRLLMVIGAVNVTACIILGLGLLMFSALPWRGAFAGEQTMLRVPTTAPTPTHPTPVPSFTPTATLSPTPTPVPSATPRPTRAPTATPEPARDIKVTARMSDRTVSRNSRVTVYGRITGDGKGIEGVPMKTVWRFKNSVATCGGVSDRDGQASCTLRLSNVSKGTEVQVLVTFTYQGQTYTATTSFRVR